MHASHNTIPTSSNLPAAGTRTRPSAFPLILGSTFLWSGTVAVFHGTTTLEFGASMALAMTVSGLIVLLAVMTPRLVQARARRSSRYTDATGVSAPLAATPTGHVGTVAEEAENEMVTAENDLDETLAGDIIPEDSEDSEDLDDPEKWANNVSW